MNGHLEERAELYALGALDDSERAQVERHLTACAACAARVGQAEATVLALIESDTGTMPSATRAPLFVAKPRTRSGFLIAAAAIVVIALAAASALFGSLQRQRAQSGEQVVAAAMLAGHFAHVPFVARVPGAPAAKVVYAREGGWMYVIAGPGRDPLDVAVVRGGVQATVSSLPASDKVRSVFVPLPGRITSVVLLDRGQTIAVAHTVYPR